MYNNNVDEIPVMGSTEERATMDAIENEISISTKYTIVDI